MAVLEVVDQVAERHPGPDEDRRTAKNFRIAVDDLGMLTHGSHLEQPFVGRGSCRSSRSSVGDPRASRNKLLTVPPIAKSLYQPRAPFSIIRLRCRGSVPPNNPLLQPRLRLIHERPAVERVAAAAVEALEAML